MQFYNKLGEAAGFLLATEDLSYVSLTKARTAPAWVSKNSRISTWDFDLPSTIIPYRHYFKMVQMEKEGEIAKDLIDRYIKSLEVEGKINR